MGQEEVTGPPRTRDELRAEFRIARWQRSLNRGFELWRDTDAPEEGPKPLDTPPAPFGAFNRGCPRCDGTNTNDLPSVNRESAPDSHECRDCGHLWSTPGEP